MENIVLWSLQILCSFVLCNRNSKCDYTFPWIIQKYTKFANFTGLYFPHFTIFLTKLHHFTKFRMLFPTVLMNIPNSKVCLKGEWSNALSRKYQQLKLVTQFFSRVNLLNPHKQERKYLSKWVFAWIWIEFQSASNSMRFCSTIGDWIVFVYGFL